jgi:AcrR family transcriptional regulator
MPKVSQEYLDARRSEILDAAIECFSHDGFHCTTMQDIVRQSGLSPGAIYNYFKSKEGLIEAIANRRQAKERQLVTGAIDGSPAVEALARLREAFLDELSDAKERLRRRVSVQLWAEAQRNAKVRKVVERSFAETRKLMSSFFVEQQKRGVIASWVDSTALAGFVIALFHGLVLQSEWDRQFSVESYKQLFDVLINTLASSEYADVGRVPRPTPA